MKYTVEVPLCAGSRRRQSACRLAVITILLSLLSLSPLTGQPGLVGRPIREVTFQGLVTLAADSLSFYLGLEIGQPYDPGVLNEKIKELWDRQLVDDLTVEAEPQGDGVKLTIKVSERPVLASLDYQGQKKINRSEIGDHLDKQRIEVYEGMPVRLGELARLQAAIKELYAERGYRFAEIHVETEPLPPNDVRVVVTIDEGGKVKIGKISFEGNEVFSAGKLRDQMKKTKKSNLVTKIRKRDVYNPATVQEDLSNIAGLYKRSGYKDIAVGEPEVEIVERNPDAKTLDGRKRQLALVIPLDEGSRWKLGDILFEGNEVLQDRMLEGVFEEPKGGWLRQDVIDEGVKKIQEFYNNTGYIFARVEPEIHERGNLVADLLIKIEENDQFRVGRIEFEGNDRTQDRVLRRELRLQEGMVFNAGALRNSLFKINQLEYFKLNEDEPVELDYRAEDKKVDLVVKGDEAERTEVQFGGGYSEIDGFFAQAALRTRNFLGRGETLGVSIQTGRYRELFDVSYFVPWLLDRPQSVGVQLFKRDVNFDLYVDQRYVRNESGFVLTFGRSFRLFENFSVSYTNSQLEDFRSQQIPGAPPDPVTGEIPSFEQAFNFDKSSITLNYGYDSHDSRLEPTRGRRVRFSVEYAGGPLGGDDYFYRPTFDLAYTVPVTRRGLRTVARANLSAGLIDPFGTDEFGDPRELYFLNYFFLGGENTIRGFAFRSIWVRDPETGQTIVDEFGFPQGGETFFHLNLEYHFLVSGPLRVVFFGDIGNVYGKDQSFDFAHARKSAGAELRINVPIFGAPLRFIYAQNLEPLENLPPFDQERFDSFDFSIGTSF